VDLFTILVLGPPGAGKTTFALQIQSLLGAELLNVSTMLREMAQVTGDESLRHDIRDAMSKGLQLTRQELNEQVSNWISLRLNKNHIIDGFPRTWQAADYLSKMVSEDKRRKFLAIHVFAEKDICRSRFFGKSFQGNVENIFEERIKNYSSVERKIISSIREWMPVFEISSARK
jgi:adenylate kinase family enzyme